MYTKLPLGLMFAVIYTTVSPKARGITLGVPSVPIVLTTVVSEL